MSIRKVCTSLRGGSTSSDLAVDDDVRDAVAHLVGGLRISSDAVER